MGSLLSFFIHINPYLFWFIFVICSVFGLVLWQKWIKNIKRARLIEDVATSNIASASQGYTELMGNAGFFNQYKMRSPLSGRECVWYHYIIERRRQADDNPIGFWDPIRVVISKSQFHLEDETGFCIIDPLDAEVICYEKKVWYSDSYSPGYPPVDSGKPGLMNINRREYRFTERWIEPAETLYAIGYFSTQDAANEEKPLEEDIEVLLNKWKLNPKKYLVDFDIDEYGRISDSEWNKIYRKAVSEIKKQRSKIIKNVPKHFLKKPQEKENLYILSSYSDEELVRMYRRKARWMLITSVTLGAFSVWILNIRF